MLRGILGRLTGGGRRRPVGGATTGPATGRTGGGTSANRDVERGARTLLRGLMRRR